jgi:hypothetical protein
MPGEKTWRIVPDNATIRTWGRGRGYRVSDHGRISRFIRSEFAEFMKLNASWTVKIVSIQPPGATQARAFFQVRQGSYLVKQTTDLFYVKRELGEEVYALLQETRK